MRWIEKCQQVFIYIIFVFSATLVAGGGQGSGYGEPDGCVSLCSTFPIAASDQGA